MPLFTCHSISQIILPWKSSFENYQQIFSSSLNGIFYIFTFILKHFHIEIPFPNQRNKSSKKKFTFFFLTVKSKMFRSHTFMYDKNEIVARFLTDNKFLFTQLNSIRVKNSPNKRKISLKHRCVIAQHFRVIC